MGTVANGSLTQVRKGKEKEADQLPSLEANRSENVEIGGASREEINKPEAAAPIPRRFVSRDGDELVRSTRAASEFSADSPVSSLFSPSLCWCMCLGAFSFSLDSLFLFFLLWRGPTCHFTLF